MASKGLSGVGYRDESKKHKLNSKSRREPVLGRQPHRILCRPHKYAYLISMQTSAELRPSIPIMRHKTTVLGFISTKAILFGGQK